VRGLEELVFSTTNQCPARCRDCPTVYGQAPVRRLKSEDMIRIVDEVSRWGSLRLVVFTGGESFLLGKSLRKTVAHISEKGLMTRIVTNAYWATSKRRAVQVLSELKALGLTEINISCDDYHQEFIPLENVRNANEAAVEVNLPALIAHRRKLGGRITIEYLSEYLGVDLHRFRPGEQNPDNNVISSGRNVPLNSNAEDKPPTPCEFAETDRDWIGACKSVLRSIVISSDLKVQICCGIALSSIPELSIGSLLRDDLIALLQRGNRDLITNWLALEGPSSILKFVRSKAPDIALPEHYVNRCHVCNELFTREDVRAVLRENAADHRDTLLMLRGTLDWISEDWAAAVS
jgi:hypothetical protein